MASENRLLRAVLRTLSELGPSPTAFGASPSADYEVDGVRSRAAPGWWVIFAAKLKITSSILPPAALSADGMAEPGEVVELRFEAASHVHGGEPFSWVLSMATDVYGVRRLVLHDQASYPEPLMNMLQYHAIGRCREHLLQQTALLLGQQLAARTGLRAVVSGVLAALGLYKESVPPDSMPSAPPAVGAWAPPPPRSAPPHANISPQQPFAAYRMLDETPRADKVPSVISALTAKDDAPASGSVSAAEAFALASSSAAVVTEPAERATGDDDPSLSGAQVPAHLRAPPLNFEDRVDALRTAYPEHSTASLRRMVTDQ